MCGNQVNLCTVISLSCTFRRTSPNLAESVYRMGAGNEPDLIWNHILFICTTEQWAVRFRLKTSGDVVYSYC